MKGSGFGLVIRTLLVRIHGTRPPSAQGFGLVIPYSHSGSKQIIMPGPTLPCAHRHRAYGHALLYAHGREADLGRTRSVTAHSEHSRIIEIHRRNKSSCWLFAI